MSFIFTDEDLARFRNYTYDDDDIILALLARLEAAEKMRDVLLNLKAYISNKQLESPGKVKAELIALAESVDEDWRKACGK